MSRLARLVNALNWRERQWWRRFVKAGKVATPKTPPPPEREIEAGLSEHAEDMRAYLDRGGRW